MSDEDKSCERCGKNHEWEKMDYWFGEWLCDYCVNVELLGELKNERPTV